MANKGALPVFLHQITRAERKKMQKNKKLLSHEAETINTKELEEDIKQAEQLIAYLKDKIDPGAIKAKRRKERYLNFADSLGGCLMAILVFISYACGVGTGLKHAEQLYHYSALVGAISTVETE